MNVDDPAWIILYKVVGNKPKKSGKNDPICLIILQIIQYGVAIIKIVARKDQKRNIVSFGSFNDKGIRSIGTYAGNLYPWLIVKELDNVFRIGSGTGSKYCQVDHYKLKYYLSVKYKALEADSKPKSKEK